MTSQLNALYSGKVSRAGALLPDTHALLRNWNLDQSADENYRRCEEENWLAKPSRLRVRHVLMPLKQRYRQCDEQIRALVFLKQHNLPAATLDWILFFHTLQADNLLRDLTLRVLLPLHDMGKNSVRKEDVEMMLFEWTAQGLTGEQWSAVTIRKIATSSLAVFRQFRVLSADTPAKFQIPHLPLAAFAYLAFWLQKEQPSGERLLSHPAWQWFFLNPETVEHLFIEAHNHRLLEYYVAGSVIRLDFPANNLEEYARVIARSTS